MSKAAAVDVFRHRGWLSQTPPAFREAVLARSDVLHLQRGQSAYDMGDDTGGLFGVSLGRLDVHVPATEAAPSLVYVAAPGFWTGELAAVTGASRRISLVAGVDSRVVRLPRASMVQIVEAEPKAWLHFAELMARNFATALAVIAMLRLDDPVSRIGALLTTLVGDSPDPAPTVRASQAELAAMAHLGKTAVNAALSDLESAGVIQRRYGLVQILDLDHCRSLTPRATDAGAARRPDPSPVTVSATV